MLVARHDQGDGLGRIDADAFQVAQRPRSGVRIEAGVDKDPDATADVKDDALAVAGAEKRELEFVFWWRRFRVRHGSNDRIVSRAHALPARRSASVIVGRSRNTIWDTRFFVPAGERS